MIGKKFIFIKTEIINYEITLNRNISIIRGDSATGKSTLYNIIDTYNRTNTESIFLNSENKCKTLDDSNWEICLYEKNTIFFIDENSKFTKSNKFGKEISKGNDNYFVIISREDNYNNLPYSYKEIYELCYDPVSNTNINIRYINDSNLQNIYEINNNYVAIVEDSKSGFQMYKCILINNIVISSEGKNKIINKLKNLDSNNVIIILDGSAIGGIIENILMYLNNNNMNYLIFAPESFEFLLLHLNIFNTKINNEILHKTYNFIDSEYFSSYEKYFFNIINEITSNLKCKYRYNKSELNENYMTNKIKDEFKKLLPNEFKNLLQDEVNKLDWI